MLVAVIFFQFLAPSKVNGLRSSFSHKPSILFIDSSKNQFLFLDSKFSDFTCRLFSPLRILVLLLKGSHIFIFIFFLIHTTTVFLVITSLTDFIEKSLQCLFSYFQIQNFRISRPIFSAPHVYCNFYRMVLIIFYSVI